MSIDFNDKTCQEIVSAPSFGLCDDDDNSPAFISTNHEDRWIATVINDKRTEILFTAIDHCIVILKQNGDMESSCDCMLSYEGNIVFVELKDKGKQWKDAGIKQLETTIGIYSDSVGFAQGIRRRAYVANRRHPNFHVLENEIKQRLFSKYEVRVMAEAIINVS